ncbi:hypothetical protein D3C81_376340 [compost metagenome]
MSNVASKRPLCIYHKNCLDGLAAAWVVWRHFKAEVDLLAAAYGDPLPEMNDLRGRQVFVVDFSYGREQVIQMQQYCELVILDHHATAATELEGLVEIDQTRSGAMLTWDYFNPDIQSPRGLQFVQDRDLWQWKLVGSKAWTTAAFSYPHDVEEFDKLITRKIGDVVLEGESLLRKHEQDVKKIARSARPMLIDGVEIPVVNANGLFASDIGNVLSEHAQFAATYIDGVDERMFSLRSRPGRADVSLVAKAFGGGGHKQAAGFRIKFDDPRFARSHLELNSEDK